MFQFRASGISYAEYVSHFSTIAINILHYHRPFMHITRKRALQHPDTSSLISTSICFHQGEYHARVIYSISTRSTRSTSRPNRDRYIVTITKRKNINTLKIRACLKTLVIDRKLPSLVQGSVIL